MKISIITATYNSANTIEDTIRSVLAQSYPDFEHIIVDGLSRDDTQEIVKRYEAQYNGRLRFISEPDKGLYDAMNKGIRMATGEVIGILNSDDFFTSDDVLLTVARELLSSDVDAVYGDVHYVKPENLAKSVRYYSSRIFRRGSMRLGFMPAHPSFYCRRSVYQQYGAFNISYRVAADFEQLLRLIFVNRIRMKYLHKDFVTMRTGGTSNANLSSRFAIMNDHRRALHENGIFSNRLLLSTRYVYKMVELAVSPFRPHTELPPYILPHKA